MEGKTNETLIREAKNQYHREWYAKNKDKAKAANRRYWLKKLAASQKTGEENGDKQD